MVDNPKMILDTMLKISSPPSGNSITFQVGANLDYVYQFLKLGIVKLAAQLAFETVLQPIRAILIEPYRLVAQNLPIHPTYLR